MNILDFYKMNNFLNKYFGFSLPPSKMVLPKCPKLILDHSGIISGTYFSPFQSITYIGASGGLKSHIWPSFGILNNFPHFLWMNNSIEYSGLYWMNIPDFVLNWILNWIIFWPDSMKKINFQNVSPRATIWWTIVDYHLDYYKLLTSGG